MKNLYDLLDQDDFILKYRQKIYDENGNMFVYDKSSEYLDDDITYWAWQGTNDLSVFPISIIGYQVEIDLTEFYLHPWYPDKEIKQIEIVSALPSLKKGTILPYEMIIPETKDDKIIPDLPATYGIHIEYNNIHDFYSAEWILGFPQFFKPLYD